MSIFSDFLILSCVFKKYFMVKYPFSQLLDPAIHFFISYHQFVSWGKCLEKNKSYRKTVLQFSKEVNKKSNNHLHHGRCLL